LGQNGVENFFIYMHTRHVTQEKNIYIGYWRKMGSFCPKALQLVEYHAIWW